MMFGGRVRRIHFVGIGGAGMCGIAEVLLTSGFEVTGSDLARGAAVRRLERLGARVHRGHHPDHVGEADVVVRSTAVPEDNPEIAAARERQIPVIRRAEMLGELMRMKQGIAVAGSHGKTTTTSLLATVLARAGLDPTIVIGGRLNALGTNARLGCGDLLVAEADESDGTFNLLMPTVAVVTGIDPEHLDHHGDLDRLVEAFVRFVNKVPFYGFAALCLDHPRVQELLPRAQKRVVTYGLSRQATWRAEEVEHDGPVTRFVAWRGGERLGPVALGMPGVHNVQNALAALAVAGELQVPFAEAAEAIASFAGVHRRFTVVGEAAGVMVVDDYGHHPAEIEATLEGARRAFPGRRLVALFQPHRYTRVRDLAPDFCRAFHLADAVVVCPIYPAGEAPIEGVDHRSLARGIRERGHRAVEVVESLDEIVPRLASRLRPGDLVIALGAGDVNRVCEPLLEALG